MTRSDLTGRYFVNLLDGTRYSGQPRPGFTSAENAHAFMERHSMLSPARYAVVFVAYDGEVLPVDLDGDPYRDTEHLGAWKMTRCCGAAVSASDPELGLYCKACYGEAHDDAPARLASERYAVQIARGTWRVMGVTPGGMIRLHGAPPYGSSLTARPADVPVLPPLAPR